MVESAKANIALVLGWVGLGDTAGLRRNDAGFLTIKEMAQRATADNPLKLNAFLYAVLCPANNLDLFLNEDVASIALDLKQISSKMQALTEFERDAGTWPSAALRETYLALRRVVARRTARDERRTLATLLFSGPSTTQQVSDELGISCGLVERVFLALAPVVERQIDHTYVLRSDTDTLAVVLHLLRSTLGVDPIGVLQRRIAAHNANNE